MRRLPLLAACLLVAACTAPAAGSPWDDLDFRGEAQQVVQHYAALVEHGYAGSLAGAEGLAVAVDAFVAAPDEESFALVKATWLAARETYGRTEVFRFYGGPIDAEPDNLEARINPWPLDESYIDAVLDDPAAYPDLDRDLLIARNGAEGEDSISTGWHAVEYLLWGADSDPAGPGARPWTDFTDGPDPTSDHPDRLRLYLDLAADLLADDLGLVAGAWSEGQSNYRAEFVADDAKDGLTKVLLGMGSLAGAELAGERMTVALETREQEDEHSCFSDNTHRDLLANIAGIHDVYLGRGGELSGPGLSDLVARLDPDLDAATRDALQAAVDAVAAIDPPFDAAIQAADGSPEREAVVRAVDALHAATAAIVAVAEALEIQLNLED